MRIIFVRHGHPDYNKDCLTELGHKQAVAAAERLREEKIDKFYSSSCGRAYETALHIADGRNMEIEKLDFMRELYWGSAETGIREAGYDPWTLAIRMVDRGQDLMSTTWYNEDPFNTSFVSDGCIKCGEDFDEWLSTLGLVREGSFYRMGKPQYDTVLLASHAGSSTAVFAHLFNLPVPFVSRAICPDFTAITVVYFEGEEGSLVCPQFEIVNDARHIKGVTAENVYGN